ncbi:MAG: thymidine phosphorylase [Actinomycetaceae bacterium]|nr:thymidine phosphorylase [Actinomycetaceae bacterium]MDU0969920.1 thymidine phosphorylase [Actinomycetaceae bacterium]
MAEPFDVVDVIRTKRDRGVLSDAQIDWVIDAYTRGVVADEQMSALAMAIFLNGMTRDEVVRWTLAMTNSGERLTFPGLTRPTTDKHSTGGVGDKTTLPLTPLVATFGAAVPQLSGRGLGHTGGTLDKLEAIPGWQASIPAERFQQIISEVGCIVCAPGADLAPADKKLYALRDITATVDCIPLIASSIMSKKIAEGTSALVLDVKVGSGAFMKDIDSARELAQTMVDLGNDAGVATRAVLTDMSRPLGRGIGNALEVKEALQILSGEGPADLVELVCTLAEDMLDLARIEGADVRAALGDGRAMETWRRMIAAQGGDPDAPLPQATHTYEVVAPRDGVLVRTDALPFGVASWRLGAGRTRKEDPVQAGAGIWMDTVVGEPVSAGQTLFTLHTDTPERFDRALEALDGAWEIADALAPEDTRESLILGRVTA